MTDLAPALQQFHQENAMTIYYDMSAAVHGEPGLGRYADSLGRALLQAHGESMSFFYYGDAGDLSRRRPGGRAAADGYAPGASAWRMQVWLGPARCGGRMDHLLPGAQLYHATEHLLLSLRDVPTVLTVHDLIFRLFPRYHKLQNYVYLNLAMPLFCRRAEAIIAVSRAHQAGPGAASMACPGQR